MNAWTTIAIVFIPLAAATTATMGQKIYRCGSEYSQVPCSNGVVVEADDPRSSAQKAKSDAMIQRNAAAAQTMETSRLKEESALRSASTGRITSSNKKKHKAAQHAANTTIASDTDNEEKKEKKASKKKEPDFFTARVTPTPGKEKGKPKK